LSQENDFRGIQWHRVEGGELEGDGKQVNPWDLFSWSIVILAAAKLVSKFH
jgi:hypothetical protein